MRLLYIPMTARGAALQCYNAVHRDIRCEYNTTAITYLHRKSACLFSASDHFFQRMQPTSTLSGWKVSFFYKKENRDDFFTKGLRLRKVFPVFMIHHRIVFSY